MKINGPTILRRRKGRIRFTSMPGAIDALRASMTISSIPRNLVEGRFVAFFIKKKVRRIPLLVQVRIGRQGKEKKGRIPSCPEAAVGVEIFQLPIIPLIQMICSFCLDAKRTKKIKAIEKMTKNDFIPLPKMKPKANQKNIRMNVSVHQ